MTAPRSRREHIAYLQMAKQRQSSGKDRCPFCEVAPDEIVKETPNFYVLINIRPYTLWDGHDVADHMLIAPKIHSDKLGDISPDAAQEYLQLVDAYESEGYNTYARAPGSARKSIMHHHTHLIKPRGYHKKFILATHKPYIRVMF